MIYSGILLFIILSNISLGLFVLSRNPKKTINRTFCLLVLFISLWNIMDFGLSLSTDPKFALKWTEIMIIGVLFIPSAHYHFAVSVIKEKDKGRKKYYLIPFGYIISLVFIPLSLSGLLISEVTPLKTGGYFPSCTLSFFPITFILFFYGFTLAGLFLLLRKFKRVTSFMEKNQLKYVLIGMLIAIFGGIFNFLLALKKGRGFPIGNICQIAFVGMTTLAIVKYHLMNIDVIIRPSIIYATLAAITTAFWASSIFFLETFLLIPSFPTKVLAIFVAIFVFNILKERVQDVIDRLLYKEKIKISEIASRITNQITSSSDSDIIINSFMKEIYNFIHPTFISLMLLNEEEVLYKLKYLLGNVDKKTFPTFIFPEYPLIKQLKKKKKGIFSKEMQNEKEEASKVSCEMEKNNIKLTIPLFIQGKVIGLLFFGEKKEGYYTFSEIDFFETVAKQLAIALDNIKLHLKLKEKITELEKINWAKTEFLNVISHELNTPLTVIIGYIYLLEKKLKEKKIDFSELIDTIKRRGKELTLLIKDMMDIAFFEKGKKYEPKKDIIDVKKVIENIAMDYNPMASNKGLKIRIDIKEEISLISDKKMLENILFKLIDNAIKFTPSGGFISIEVEKKDNEVLFFVKDTGIGIADKNKEKIFERFFQVDSLTTRRKYRGVGVGLSIAKDIVVALSGRIWVESEPGKGSTFFFTLKDLENIV